MLKDNGWRHQDAVYLESNILEQINVKDTAWNLVKWRWNKGSYMGSYNGFGCTESNASQKYVGRVQRLYTIVVHLPVGARSALISTAQTKTTCTLPARNSWILLFAKSCILILFFWDENNHDVTRGFPPRFASHSESVRPKRSPGPTTRWLSNTSELKPKRDAQTTPRRLHHFTCIDLLNIPGFEAINELMMFELNY